MNVDLPQPDGPMMAVARWPRCRASMPCSTRLSPNQAYESCGDELCMGLRSGRSRQRPLTPPFVCRRLRRRMAMALSTSIVASSTTIPAAALTRNSCCGRDTQLKIWIGSAVNGASMPSGKKGDVGERADDDQRRRLADRARKCQDGSGQDAGQRRRQHHLADRLPARRAERVAGLAQGHRHRAQRLARGHDDDRQDQQRQRGGAREQAATHARACARTGRGRAGRR